jgi:hypothetical protein
MIIKSELTNDPQNISSINNNYATYYQTNNVIKTINLQAIEPQQQQLKQQTKVNITNNRAATVKQLSMKNKPIKILSHPIVQQQQQTTNKTSNIETKTNTELRTISSMPTLINNLNGFNNLTKTISAK